jgi:esterase/lipase superfamily enzyme
LDIAHESVKLALDNSLLIDTPPDWQSLTIGQLFTAEDVFGRFVTRLNNRLNERFAGINIHLSYVESRDLTFEQLIAGVERAIQSCSKEIRDDDSALADYQKQADHQKRSRYHEESDMGGYSRSDAAEHAFAPAPNYREGFEPLRITYLSLEVVTVVRVFFATDRKPNKTGTLTFGTGRSDNGELSLGECQVSIPKSHKLGKLESPSLLRLEFSPDPQKHIVLASSEPLDQSTFYGNIAQSVQTSSAKDALVFIHGYNVTFEDAARRTAQIAFDLSFLGAALLYSWPSQGKLASYIHDETNVEWTTPHLIKFLKALADQSGAERIHIIAHSMGNRAVCNALRGLKSELLPRPIPLIHLVLAAADLDADTFRDMAKDLQASAEQITLYQSSNDKALLASKELHGNPRAGEPVLIVPGMDAIDASAIDTDFLGHGYFSDTWPLLSDISYILRDNKAPAARFGLEKREYEGLEYFAFRA